MQRFRDDAARYERWLAGHADLLVFNTARNLGDLSLTAGLHVPVDAGVAAAFLL